MFRPLACLALVAACSSSSRAPETPPKPAAKADAAPAADARPQARLSGPPRMLHGIYFVDEGAPDPLACRADNDCIGDTVVAENGCCTVSSDIRPQTWAWHTWTSERRIGDGCAHVRCAAPPKPSPPERCLLEGRCVKGRCENT